MTQTASAPAGKYAPPNGKPAKSVPFHKEKRYGDAELKELKEALDSGTLFYASGTKVKALEKQFAAKHACRHGVACSSGTAAIHTAVMAAGISPGDEVIVPPITDMGTILPVMWQGAIPVFTDLDPTNYNLSPEAIEKNITPRTRAVIAVHLAGNPCDLNAISALCDKHRLLLIEDCAQAHGTTYNGKPVGSIGHIGCFSYNEFKHIACGDGGVVVTNDAEMATKLRLATDKGYNRAPGAADRNATFMANNYRMTELQGAVAIAQLAKVDSIVQRRQSWCGRLTERIGDVPGLQLPRPTPSGTHTYWFYMMTVDPQAFGGSADDFAAALKAEGLPAAAHYIGKPIYEYPLFRDHSAFDHGAHPFKAVDYTQVKCPAAETILKNCVILSVNESYNDRDLDETVTGFKRVIEWFQSKRTA
jgi:dTDP-4-amino-4,6-dideoxygalactose transaminase